MGLHAGAIARWWESVGDEAWRQSDPSERDGREQPWNPSAQPPPLGDYGPPPAYQPPGTKPVVDVSPAFEVPNPMLDDAKPVRPGPVGPAAPLPVGPIWDDPTSEIASGPPSRRPFRR